MLGNSPFYHSSLRKLVSAFGVLFNDVFIVRTFKDGAEKERVRVPLAYGPKEKYLARAQQDPTLNRPVAITLPRMSFVITSLRYAGARKLNTIHKNTKITSDNRTLMRQFNPVAYDVDFELSIMVKNIDDGNQIIEQILPFFTPDFTITINSIPSLSLKDDLPITLHNVSYSDNYDDSWEKRREIIWTLSFTAQALFYGPIREQEVITTVQSDILIPEGSPHNKDDRDKTPRSVRTKTSPKPPNADLGDDFGYTESTEEFNDHKKFNPHTLDDEEV